MTIVTFEVYSAGVGLTKNALDTLLEGAIVLGAEGVLNLKWDDFSAESVAEELGLPEREVAVFWGRERDDTPGSLILRVLFTYLTPEEVQSRFARNGVAEYLL